MSDLKSEIHDMPHYTEEYYRQSRTIWGIEIEGLEYVYSDRLRERDYNQHRKALLNTKAKQHTAGYWQEYLLNYYEKPVEIVHILAGHNLSSGYPYQVFGFMFCER